MNSLLVCTTLVVAVLCLLEHRKTRKQWGRIVKIIDAVTTGKRPASFIVHGDSQIRRIAFGLEELADQRDRMLRQISQEGFNLQTILSSMAEGVIVLDTTRCIRLVNASFLRLFEMKTAPVGQSVLHALRNAAIENLVRTALITGDAEPREIAVEISGRQLAVSAAPVRDAAGALLGVAAIFHDITRLKQLEEVRREFVGNVSHELRTPLSIFQGHLEMLLDYPDIPREELMQSLKVLQKHSQRLNALVEDLLTLARLESRPGALELAPVRLAELLQSIAQDWTFKFSNKQVRFRLEVAQDLPPVLADAFRIEQVMYNLLENALKYTPAGGEVAVIASYARQNTSSRTDTLELRVSDTGSGIPAADLPHIFERFYRADKARSRALGGTGLGLSIVKHIIQLHGGNVHAESVYGTGAEKKRQDAAAIDGTVHAGSPYGTGTSIVIRLPAAHLLADQASGKIT